AHAAPRGKEFGHRIAPESHYQAWLNENDLAFQIFMTGGKLIWKRIAITGWTTFQDIRNVNVLALQPDEGEQLIKQLPSRTDKGPPLLVLPITWSLADEHDCGA